MWIRRVPASLHFCVSFATGLLVVGLPEARWGGLGFPDGFHSMLEVKGHSGWLPVMESHPGVSSVLSPLLFNQCSTVV